MLGAIIAVTALNMITNSTPIYPPNLRVVLQILSGIFIGSRFSRDDISQLRIMLVPVVIQVVLMLSINALFAWLLSAFTGLSLVTALFAAAPGGVSDLAIIAADFGADTQQVALLQLFRFVVVVSVFPFVMRKMAGDTGERAVSREAETSEPTAPPQWYQLPITLLAGAAGGLLLRHLGVPAGALIGSMIAAIILSVGTKLFYIPKAVRVMVQICSGCYIGSRMSRDLLSSLSELLLPMVFILLELFVMSFGTGWVVHKLTKLNHITSVFGCVPGGISEMGIIAEDLGLDVPKIVLMHSCRLIAAICVIPMLPNLFL